MAAPSIVGTASTGTFNAASFTPADASGYSAGDSLLLMVAQDDVGTHSTTSSGWVKLGNNVVNSGGTLTSSWFYKKNAAGPGSDSITVSSTVSERGTYILQPITGQDTGTDAYIGAGATGNSSSANPPSLSPAGGSADYLWVAAAGTPSTTVPSAAPANYTDLITRAPATSSCGSALAFRQLTASSEDPGGFTHSGQQWMAQTIAVPPAAGGGTAHSLATVIDGVGTISPALTRGVHMASAVSGVGTVSAALVLDMVLAAQVNGVGTVSPSLTRGVHLATLVAGVGTVAADLTVSGGPQTHSLAAVVDALAQVTPALTRGTHLASAISGVATVSPSLLRQVNLAAQIDAVAAVSPKLVASLLLHTTVSAHADIVPVLTKIGDEIVVKLMMKPVFKIQHKGRR